LQGEPTLGSRNDTNALTTKLGTDAGLGELSEAP